MSVVSGSLSVVCPVPVRFLSGSRFLVRRCPVPSLSFVRRSPLIPDMKEPPPSEAKLVTITITIRKHPSHNREEPGIFSTCNRGPARRSHDRRGYDLLGLSAGMFDHTYWHPHLPQGTTPGLVPAAMWSPRPFRPSFGMALLLGSWLESVRSTVRSRRPGARSVPLPG